MNKYLKKFHDSISSLKETQLLDEGMISLKSLLQTPFLMELINDSLSQLNTKEHYYPERSSMNYWHIVNTKNFTFTLIKMKKELQSKFVNSYSYDKIIVPLTENICYSHYKQIDPFPINELDTEKKLIPFAIKQILEIGTPYPIKKHEDVFSYHGGNDEESILLSLSCKNASDFGWEYDAKTLLPLRLVTNVLQSARLEHTCKLLGELGSSSSLNNLFSFLKNPYHNVRWEAARAIMSIDFNKGLEALSILEEDKHPDIRMSVKNALQQISTLNLS